ncbi:MAG: hypothetical protein ACD_8C00057G0021 [uncultured bacterium]|nr:MAG: hypothetical protein ACD_8C00057G0021 [uncultured bacterium]
MVRNILLVVFSLLIVVIFIVLGFYANAPVSGLLVGIIVGTGIVAAVTANGINLAQARTCALWLGVVILFLALPRFVIGICVPRANVSIDRISKNHKQAIVNTLDKYSLKSEAECGVFGIINENSGVYDENMKEVWYIKVGAKIKAADLSGKPAEAVPEGYSRVVIHNVRGDFADGNVVYIPSRKINWL